MLAELQESTSATLYLIGDANSARCWPRYPDFHLQNGMKSWALFERALTPNMTVVIAEVADIFLRNMSTID